MSDVPTLEQVLAAEDKRLRDAVCAAYRPGMDLQALVSATMKRLRGQAVPGAVIGMAREFLPRRTPESDE